LGSFLANVLYQLYTGKDDNPFEPKDLMPQFGNDAPEPISKEDAIMALDTMFSALAAANPAPTPILDPSPKFEEHEFGGREEGEK
jgi:hypothetical protein